MIQLPESSHSPSLMPDMTALLDVIFILLVFMMLTANVAPQLLEMDLPQVTAPAESVEPNAITLGITEQGSFSISSKEFSNWERFQAALNVDLKDHQDEFGAKPQVLVAADKDASIDVFVKLASWLSEQGLSVAEVIVSGDTSD